VCKGGKLIYFTSDYHLGHANIIRYCGRPYKDLEEMDNSIINNHNSRVCEGDIVYHIGDFCFRNSPGGKKGEGVTDRAGDYHKKLNGRIIHILGNHDRNNSVQDKIKVAVIHYGGKEILLKHKPPQHKGEIPDYCDLVLCGHIHEKWDIKWLDDVPLINVGVDVWNFKPATIDEIMARLAHNPRQ
jgi:calcineurin-like phosphoesterase family protein